TRPRRAPGRTSRTTAAAAGTTARSVDAWAWAARPTSTGWGAQRGTQGAHGATGRAHAATGRAHGGVLRGAPRTRVASGSRSGSVGSGQGHPQDRPRTRASRRRPEARSLRGAGQTPAVTATSSLAD